MSDQGFDLFGPGHLTALAVIAAAAAGLPWLVRRHPGRKAARAASLAIGTALVLVETGKVLSRIFVHDWPVAEALPLHLCGLASFLTALVLLTGSRKLFGVVYFWAVGGTLHALLTPDLDGPFPEPIALGFFASHGLILVGVSHAAFGLGLRTRWSDLLWSWLWLNVYAALLLPFNLAFGTNYLYLVRKPPGPTLLDLLGDWPWYLLACELLALAQAVLWQLPWALAGRRGQTGPGETE